MQRLLSTATIVGLLIATAAAFAITERLKLEKGPLTGVFLTKVFSPTCRCSHDRAVVRVRLRRADTLTVTILDSAGQPVRTLADARPVPRGWNAFTWDGATDLGGRAPDGVYDIRLHLAARRATIVLPRPDQFVVDTRPPLVESVDTNRTDNVFSPDGDGQADYLRFSYKLSEPAHLVAFLHGARVLYSRAHTAIGSVSWRGGVPGSGPLPAGDYTLEIAAADPAGNVTPRAQWQPLRVTIRFIELASHRIAGVGAGTRFSIGVSTDAKRYHWRLGARRGTAHGPLLVLRAPALPGRYTLTVTEHGHSDRAAVIVR